MNRILPGSRVTTSRNKNLPEAKSIASRPILARHVFAILGLLSLLSITWAIATPLMGVPDEPSHTIRAAAVAHGQAIGEVQDGDTFTYPRVEVPQYIVEATHLGCFAGDAGAPASCQIAVSDDDTMVPASSSASSNSPIYYAIVGLPSVIMTGSPALYAMRIVSALLTSLLLTVMIVALYKQSRSWWPVTAGIVGVTPMALFLAGAINPNGAEMASAGAVLSVVSLILRRDMTNRQLWGYGGIAILSSFVLTGGRSIGLLWLVIIAISLLIYTPWSRISWLLRKPPVWFTLGGIAAAALTLILWFTFSVTAIDPTGNTPNRPPGITAVILITLEATFDNWVAWIGQFGWLDYNAPSGAQVAWHAAIAALLLSALIFAAGRARLTLIFVAAAAIMVPPLVQASLFNEVGWLWQGRYGIALYLSCLLWAGIILDDVFPNSRNWVSQRFVRLGVIALSMAQIATYIFVLRRYVVASNSWSAMLRDPSWQPPLGWMTLVAITCIGWVCVIALVFRWTSLGHASSTAPSVPESLAATLVGGDDGRDIPSPTQTSSAIYPPGREVRTPGE